jgi:RHS repeat-associated protein
VRFSGQYADAETGLFENWHRYYDPPGGRYLQPEPLIQRPEAIASAATIGTVLLAFAYAANNPLRYVDANGLEVQNLSPNPVVVKVEEGNGYIVLEPGQTYNGQQDAVYVEGGGTTGIMVWKSFGNGSDLGGSILISPTGWAEIFPNPGEGGLAGLLNYLGGTTVGPAYIERNGWMPEAEAKKIIDAAKKGKCGGSHWVPP